MTDRKFAHRMVDPDHHRVHARRAGLLAAVFAVVGLGRSSVVTRTWLLTRGQDG